MAKRLVSATMALSNPPALAEFLKQPIRAARGWPLQTRDWHPDEFGVWASALQPAGLGTKHDGRSLGTLRRLKPELQAEDGRPKSLAGP